MNSLIRNVTYIGGPNEGQSFTIVSSKTEDECWGFEEAKFFKYDLWISPNENMPDLMVYEEDENSINRITEAGYKKWPKVNSD